MTLLKVRGFLGSDYGSTALKKATVIVFGLASSALIARYLGPSGRGDYALILNWAAIASVILNFGISSSYQNARRSAGVQVFSSYVAYSCGLFVAVISLSALFLFFGSRTLFFVGVLSGAMVLRMQLQAYHMIESLQGDARAVFLAHLFNCVCLLGVFLLFPSLLELAIWVLIGKELVLSGLSLRGLAIQHSRSNEGVRSGLPFLAEIVSAMPRIMEMRLFSSLPFLLLTILIVVNYKIDVVFLSILGVDPFLIGIFSVGVVMAEYLWVASDIFKDVQVSRTSKGSRAEGVAKAVRMALAATLLVYAIFIISGRLLIATMFGSDFYDSYSIAVLMLAANVCMIPCKIVGSYLISINQTKEYLASMVAAVVVNIALNIALIPVMGIYGSVVASMISYSIPGAVVTRVFLARTGLRVRNLFVITKSDVGSIRSLFSRND